MTSPARDWRRTVEATRTWDDGEARGGGGAPGAPGARRGGRSLSPTRACASPCVVEHANGDALTHIWSYHNVNVTLLTACSHADTLINPRVRPTGRTVVCATRSHLNTSDFSPPESCMPGPFLNAATSVWIASCVFLMDGRSRMSITAHAPALASAGCPKS